MHLVVDYLIVYFPQLPAPLPILETLAGGTASVDGMVERCPCIHFFRWLYSFSVGYCLFGSSEKALVSGFAAIVIRLTLALFLFLFAI